MSEMALGKQVGPLPLGGWLVVVAGGLGIAYVVSRGQARSDAREEPIVEPGVGTGLVPAGSVIQPPASGDDDTPDDNQAWSVRAINYLIGLNTDPATAQRAVNKYLAGEQLTVAENALVNLALVRFGAPPEPVLPAPPPTTPPPVTPPPSTPTGTPALSVKVPSSVRAKTFFKATGRATIGGKAPGTPQTIKVTGFFTDNKTPGQVWIAVTNSNGDFTVTLHSGSWPNLTRRYDFEWKGVRYPRFVRTTK